MRVSPLAGKPAPESILVNVPRLMTAYYALERRSVRRRRSASRSARRAIAARRPSARSTRRTSSPSRRRSATIDSSNGIDGPLFLGIDTHALSEPAFASALEVLAANGVDVMIDDRDGYTPTPVVSHAILTLQPRPHDRPRRRHRHHAVAQSAGGRRLQVQPAERRAGRHRRSPRGSRIAPTRCSPTASRGVRRMPFARALQRADDASPRLHRTPTSTISAAVIDFDAIRGAGVDARRRSARRRRRALLGRDRRALRHRRSTVVNDVGRSDLPLHDASIGTARSAWTARRRTRWQRLIGLKDRFDVALACDTDHDRHGIVTPSAGLLNPNHYLAVAISTTCSRTARSGRATAGVGKTVVSSSMIDRVAARLGRRLVEVPVGFKWFVDGLLDGSLGFGGEESAGASFLRRDGTVWTTDKDGIILGLLAAEMTARDGARSGRALSASSRASSASRSTSASMRRRRREQKAALSKLSAEQVTATELAGEPIDAMLTTAPGTHGPDRRAESHDRERLVRRAAVGTEKYLQALRRELSRQRALEADSGGGSGHA